MSSKGNISQSRSKALVYCSSQKGDKSKDVVLGLLTLLEQNKQVPFHTGEMLRSSDVMVDDGPLADRILKSAEEKRIQAAIVGVAGPKTVGLLIDQLLTVNSKYMDTRRLTQYTNNLPMKHPGLATIFFIWSISTVGLIFYGPISACLKKTW